MVWWTRRSTWLVRCVVAASLTRWWNRAEEAAAGAVSNRITITARTPVHTFRISLTQTIRALDRPSGATRRQRMAEPDTSPWPPQGRATICAVGAIWGRTLEGPVAWLSCDVDDADASWFWRRRDRGRSGTPGPDILRWEEGELTTTLSESRQLRHRDRQ
jgi:hypothetical protein